MRDEEKELPRKDFPEMYRKASAGATRSQNRFLAWNRVNFTVLTLAAVTSAFRDRFPTIAPPLGVILLASGAAMTFWLRKSGYERRWYSSRAIAESVKTLSWRYMMRATPFEGETNAAAGVFEQFVDEIAQQEAASVPELKEVTTKMNEVRSRTVAERSRLYLRERIEDERSWYADNKEQNEKMGQRVLWFAITTQIVACVFALLTIVPKFPDFVGVFATFAASALAWMQLKKYEDLTQAYDTAAKELRKIAKSFEGTLSDADLSRYVLDAENAISREHTLWLAKRVDVRMPPLPTEPKTRG